MAGVKKKESAGNQHLGQCQRRKRNWHRDGPDKKRLGEQVPQWPEFRGDGD